VTDLDRKKPETAERIKAFDESLSTKLGDESHELPDVIPGSSFFLEDVELNDDEGPEEPTYADGEEGAVEQDAFTPDAMDNHLPELLLPDGDNLVRLALSNAQRKDEIPLGFITRIHWLILESIQSNFRTDRLLNIRRISSRRISFHRQTQRVSNT
jgi:hypothetical protein